jgi:hypothetical protein
MDVNKLDLSPVVGAEVALRVRLTAIVTVSSVVGVGVEGSGVGLGTGLKVGVAVDVVGANDSVGCGEG